ncbi:MAG TPA: histidine kinase [Streptosporangiaceae bacterium]|nr:histidine kinase [Streptosporangiaceae bacterium]
MSALYAWLRRHPRLVDAGLAVPITLGGLASAFAGRRGIAVLVLIVIVFAMTVPIVFRRAHPIGAFTTATVAGALQVVVNLHPLLSDFSILILLYSLAAYSTRRNSLIGLAVCLLGSAMEVVRLQFFIPAHVTSEAGWLLIFAIAFAGPSLIAWVLGDSTRYRRAYYVNLEERAARLERDRDTHAQIAAAAERARIARELHDVVAHNVSVMVVQADGATYAIDADPQRARAALAAISATGRQALAEMRALLGVLRRGDDDTGLAALAPQPGLGQLDELLDQTRAAGLPVACVVEGAPRPLAAGTALTAYRIIQESLTNTRKHGGAAATANVVLRYSETALELTITDSGAGATAACDGAGHGLTGMTERAFMYGGSVHAGPRPGGGFEVTAWLPVVPLPVSAA